MFLIVQIGKHTLIWYTAFFATVLMVSRSLIMEDYQVFDPVGVMRQITSHTHYMPRHWRNAENTETVRLEFEGLFKVKVCFKLDFKFLVLSYHQIPKDRKLSLLFMITSQSIAALRFGSEAYSMTPRTLALVLCHVVLFFKEHAKPILPG
jgi:hypothetical protein